MPVNRSKRRVKYPNASAGGGPVIVWRIRLGQDDVAGPGEDLDVPGEAFDRDGF